MFALDLFNTDHERRLAEGAVDQLEQRRIDDLAMRMDDLVARAKKADTPEHKAALVKEFQKCKDERDSYFKIKDECMGYGTLVGETEEQEEWYDANGRPSEHGCYDAGGRYHPDREPDMDAGYDAYKEREWTDESGGIGHDLVTPQQRVKQSQPQKQTPVGKVVDTAKQAAKWLAGKGGPGKEGPTYESELDEGFVAPVGSKALMNGNLATFMKARQAKTPVTLEIGGEQFRLTPTMMDAMAKKYNDDKAVSDADPTNRDTKLIAINNYRAFGYPQLMRAFIDGVATPEPTPPSNVAGEQLPMFEKKSAQKKKYSDPIVSREIQKARAAYPSANSDIEALVKRELETDNKQDLAIANLDAENKELFQKLDAIVSGSNQTTTVSPATATPTSVATPAIPNISAVTPTAGAPAMPATIPTVGTGPVAEPATKEKTKTSTVKQPVKAEPEKIKKTTTKKSKKTSYRPARTRIQRPTTPALSDPNTIDVDAWEVPTIDIPTDLDNIEPVDVAVDGAANDSRVIAQKAAEGIEKPTGIGQMAQNVGQGQELQNDPAYRRDVRRTQQQVAQRQQNVARQQAGYGNDADEFGDIPDINESNMSELDIMVQDLNPHRMSDRQFLKAYGISKVAFQQKYRTLLKPTQQQNVPHTLHEDERLHVGDPIVVTGPNEFEGKTGEIYDFSPSGTFVIVDLYNHGKHSMHLSDIAYNEYADQEEEDDWYDNEVEEGFQDFNKVEPYAVCLAGKPVKKFDYYEQARRFHDNWKKKLYREGDKAKADKITLMPLNLDEEEQKTTGWGEFPPKQEITIVPPKKLKSGETYQDRNKYWQSQGQAPIYKTNEVTNRHFGPKGAGTELARQIRANGDTNWVNDLSKDQLNALAGPRYPKRPKIQVKKNKGVTEAGSPAQQAAIAIAMKKAGKKPKQVNELEVADLVRPGVQTDTPPRRAYSIALQGRPGKDFMAEYAWDALQSVFPREYPVGTDVAERKVANVGKRGSAIVKTGIASEDIADTYVAKLAAKRVPAQFWRIIGGELEEGTVGEGSWIVYDPETKQIRKRFKTHTAGKSYAKTHGLGFASSEYYFDRVKDQQPVSETVTDIKSEMAKVYRRLAPKIERYKDSFLAGQLYDELENIAELHGAEEEFKRMMAGARNRAHMDYDTNPGGFQNWFWYLPFGDQEISEESSTSSDAVERAILHRIMVDDKLRNMAMDVGMDKVFQAVEEVAYNVGDVDEIGSSDVSGWINQVKQILGVEA